MAKFTLTTFFCPSKLPLSSYIVLDYVVTDSSRPTKCHQGFGPENIAEYGVVFYDMKVPFENRWECIENRMPVCYEDRLGVFSRALSVH